MKRYLLVPLNLFSLLVRLRPKHDNERSRQTFDGAGPTGWSTRETKDK